MSRNGRKSFIMKSVKIYVEKFVKLSNKIKKKKCGEMVEKYVHFTKSHLLWKAKKFMLKKGENEVKSIKPKTRWTDQKMYLLFKKLQLLWKT